jgi:hypothetical protein
MKKSNSQLERLYLLLVEDILEGDINVAKQVISDAGYDPEVTKIEGERKLQEIIEIREQEQTAPDCFFLNTDFHINPSGGLHFNYLLPLNSTSICTAHKQITKEDVTGDVNDAYAQANEPECHFNDTLHLNRIYN